MQNSPQEARNMLLQNPQLAYALLQAQVVMRIVDPEIALVRDVDQSETLDFVFHLTFFHSSDSKVVET